MEFICVIKNGRNQQCAKNKQIVKTNRLHVFNGVIVVYGSSLKYKKRHERPQMQKTIFISISLQILLLLI